MTNQRQIDFAISAGLFAIVVALYWPVRAFEFLDFDDHLYATNPKVLEGLSLSGIKWALTTFDASNWHPLTWLSLMLDVELFGPRPGAFHLVNVFLHGINAVLVFWLVRIGVNGVWAAAVTAALFAFHPLRVESVAWISERKDLLFALFGLLSLLSYVQFHRLKKNSLRTLAVACYAASLLSKPMLVTLPFVLLLVDAWFLGRWKMAELGRLWTDAAIQRNFTRLAWEKWPFWVLAIGSCVVTVLAQAGEIVAMQNLDPAFKIQNAIVAYARYLGVTFWPVQLAALYPLPSAWPIWIVAASMVVVVGAIALGWRYVEASPHLVIGLFWFLGTLVPTIGLLQVGNHSMADRYTYFPHIGLILGVVLWAQSRVQTKAAIVITAIVLAACVVLTRAQLPHWRSSLALHSHTVAVTKDNYMAHLFLGNALVGAKRAGEARAHYEEALRLKPVFPMAYKAHHNLAEILEAHGELEPAFRHFYQGAKLKPDEPQVLYRLGICYARSRDVASAENCFRQALSADPHFEPAQISLALLLSDSGKVEETLKRLIYLKERGTKDERIYYKLASIAASNRQFSLAVQDLQTALRLKPDDMRSLQLMAYVQSETGNHEAALRYFKDAVRLHPDKPEVLLALAWFLVNCPHENLRNATQAITHAERARQLQSPPTTQTLDVLASAYATAGQFNKASEAIEELKKMLAADAEAIRTLDERQKLYQSGRAKP